MAMKRSSAFRATPQGQRGVILIIALVMMVTVTFAGLALFRQIGLGAVIIGNLAFKQSATNAADRGVESARAWLTDSLHASILQLQGGQDPTIPILDAAGSEVTYYPAACFTQKSDWAIPATTDTSCSRAGAPVFDPLTYDWAGTGKSTIASGISGLADGNTVRYVVHRLCDMDGTVNEVREFGTGTPAIQSCVLPISGEFCLDKGGKYAKECISQSVQPFYRITAQVRGDRNTVSYVEVVLY